MKHPKTFCALCALTTAFAIVFSLVNNGLLSVVAAGEPAAAEADNKNIFRLLQDERVVAFNLWSIEDGESKNLTYAIQGFDQHPDHDGAGVKLSIYDHTGAEIYEDRFSEVQSIYPSYALRKAAPQLIMEVSYGGSVSFLKMLDYQNGKVVDLLETVKPNNDFTISAEVRPQLRSGINPAKEPYQVLLTEGVGLASPAAKYTNVLRYKDGSYRHFGRFSTQKLDDYIEKSMQVQSSGKVK